jgi:SAM-dependent methyltransferase
MNFIMSTLPIYNAVLRIATNRHTKSHIKYHLDIGSGSGALIRVIQEAFQVESKACDYTEVLMKLPEQKVDVADLNVEGLPYPSNSFDLVTATEVIEHLEHYRQTLREIHRVLKPGGLCILSTPNVLNINSRLRYFFTGFANLFGPMPIKNSALYSTGGHINPVGYFYIAHSLYDAGFVNIEVSIDKKQRSGFFKLLFLGFPLFLGAAWCWRQEAIRYKTLTAENLPIVKRLNSLDLLLGRTTLVKAVKPEESIKSS